jgi:hypothetical protein
MVKSNLPDMFEYSHTSIRTFDDIPSHPLHNELEQASKHIKEYETLPLDTSSMNLSEVKTIYNNYQQASLLVHEIEQLRIQRNKIIQVED